MPEGAGPSQLAADANVRPEIAVSWWRSELLGVRPELAIEALASEPLHDADERLRRAVQPVLDELVTRLAGTARRRPARRGHDGALPGLVGTSQAWTALCTRPRRAARRNRVGAVTEAGRARAERVMPGERRPLLRRTKDRSPWGTPP